MGFPSGVGRVAAVASICGVGLLASLWPGLSVAATSGSGPPLLGGPQLSGAGDQFAGYLDYQPVTSLSASWRVPTVARGSRPGQSLTWIGALDLSGSDPPFIQIGTGEQSGLSGLHYETFWSDTHRGDHLQPLFGVAPGDTITASMDLSDGRWHLSISDQTTGVTRTFVTREEAGYSFVEADWMQEDPSSSDLKSVLTYPNVTNTRMYDLSVNSAAPVYGEMLSTWMSLPGGYLAPSAVRGNVFSIAPQRLSGTGVAYLKIAQGLAPAEGAFTRAYQGWKSSTAVSTLEAATNNFLPALQLSVDRLRARAWPTAAMAQITTLEENENAELEGLKSAASQGYDEVNAVINQANANYPADPELICRLLNVEQFSTHVGL